MVFGLALLALILTGWWLAVVANDPLARRRTMLFNMAANAVLANYTVPAGTHMIDPAGLPPTDPLPPHVLPLVDERGRSMTAASMYRDPVLERYANTAVIRNSDEVVVFVHSLITSQGQAFVKARVNVLDSSDGVLRVNVTALQMNWGTFPMYRQSGSMRTLTDLRIAPNTPATMPTVLAGQPESGNAAWKLPLIVNGKTEWIRFDHSGVWPAVTASFGRITRSGMQDTLSY